jgi:hypothetical protein
MDALDVLEKRRRDRRNRVLVPVAVVGIFGLVVLCLVVGVPAALEARQAANVATIEVRQTAFVAADGAMSATNDALAAQITATNAAFDALHEAPAPTATLYFEEVMTRTPQAPDAAAPPTQEPTQAPTLPPVPTQTVQPTQQQDLTVPVTGNCDVLGDPASPVGFVCFPRDASTPSYTIPVYEGGFSILAIGNGDVDGESVANTLGLTTDGTEGNIVVFPGHAQDGSTPGDLNDMSFVLQDGSYTSGAFAAVTVWEETSYEDALAAAVVEAEKMLENPPNCGQNGCKTVYVWVFNWGTGVFDLYMTLTR